MHTMTQWERRSASHSAVEANSIRAIIKAYRLPSSASGPSASRPGTSTEVNHEPLQLLATARRRRGQGRASTATEKSRDVGGTVEPFVHLRTMHCNAEQRSSTR